MKRWLMLMMGVSSIAMAEERFNLTEDCFTDNRTELVWQTHSADMAINARYFWYNSNAETNSGHAGYQSFAGQKAVCVLDADLCNTEALIAYHNQVQTCGRSDWRLPNKSELMTLLSFGGDAPHTFDELKAFTQATVYLSDETARSRHEMIWAVDFASAQKAGHYKRIPAALRLVSGP